MPTRLVLWIAIAVIVLGAIGLIVGRRLSQPKLSDEEQVGRLLVEAKRAVEAKNASALIRLIDPEFDSGGLTRTSLSGMIAQGMRSSGHLDVLLSTPRIQIRADRASLEVEVELTPNHSPAEAQRMVIQAELRKSGGKWRVLSATGWEPAAGALAGMD